MELKFLEIETSVKSKHNQVFCVRNQRRCRKEPVLDFEDGYIEKRSTRCVETVFTNTKESLRYCNVLPVFCFNSAIYENVFLKSNLLPLLVNEGAIEPIMLKKANQFVSFRFEDLQLLDILGFLGGATNFDSFLKASKT